MIDDLVNLARDAALRAYAPYSNFHVGAAILTKSGNIYTGANIETYNSEGQTCAERNAIARMISAGEVSNDPFVIDKIAVTCIDVKDVDNIADVSPCGACRQVISEFSDENTVIIIDDKDKYPKFKMAEILPFGFHLSPKPDNLKIDVNLDGDLNQIAKEVSAYAYTPISKNKVGAALLSSSGKIYIGAAVDNSSTGLYISAERSAVANAIMAGEVSKDNQKFIKEIVIYNHDNDPRYIVSSSLLAEFLIA